MPQSLEQPFHALHSQGIAAAQAGRFDDALSLLDRALRLVPHHPQALVDRANVLRLLGRYPAALADFTRAVESRPDFVEGHFYRAWVLGELGRVEEALAGYERVLALRPDFPDAHNNAGNALKHLGRFDEAMRHYDRALALKPDYAEAHFNKAIALQGAGELDAALAAYDRAIAADPGHVDAHWNKSLVLLLLGRYEEGWALYEWRWKRKRTREFAAPAWGGGEPLEGRTILLHAEQGFGDALQFCRYAPLVARRGARVLLEVPPELVAVMRSLAGVERVIARGEPLPAFDLHSPLLSLPHAFHTDLAHVPSDVPYLHAMPEKRARWREKLGPATKRRVGVLWSGRPAQTDDYKRSMCLEDLAPLLSMDCDFVSLQKEVRGRDRPALEAHANLRHFGDQLEDFGDTAALCEAMDLIVSVDSSVAHLAGALGKPLWVMLAAIPDWRWLLERDDCPWYPSARLYRQPRAGDWASVVERVRRDLGAMPAPAA